MSVIEYIGEAMFLAIVQITLVGNEATSLYAASTQTNTQKDLDGLAAGIKHYLIVGIVWTIATSLIMYAKAGTNGVLLVILLNILVMAYILLRFRSIVRQVAIAKNLQEPPLL